MEAQEAGPGNLRPPRGAEKSRVQGAKVRAPAAAGAEAWTRGSWDLLGFTLGSGFQLAGPHQEGLCKALCRARIRLTDKGEQKGKAGQQRRAAAKHRWVQEVQQETQPEGPGTGAADGGSSRKPQHPGTDAG